MNLHPFLSRYGNDGLIHGNYRCDLRFLCLSDKGLHDTQIVIVNDGVQGQVGTNVFCTAAVGYLLQVIQGEIDRGTCPHIQLLHSNVNRICSIVECRLQGLEITRRSHELNLVLAVHYHSAIFSELQKYDIFLKCRFVKKTRLPGKAEIN